LLDCREFIRQAEDFYAQLVMEQSRARAGGVH
jgi:hypothetical protein